MQLTKSQKVENDSKGAWVPVDEEIAFIIDISLHLIGRNVVQESSDHILSSRVKKFFFDHKDASSDIDLD
jgi:hypothetical protein